MKSECYMLNCIPMLVKLAAAFFKQLYQNKECELQQMVSIGVYFLYFLLLCKVRYLRFKNQHKT